MRHTLLLAVADDFNRRELFRQLSGRGLFVVEATAPSQVIERICCFYPDVVLLDLQTMKDNLDVCRKLSKVCDRPIIIATSELEEEARAKGHELGVGHFIPKPIDTEDLSIQIKKLCKKRPK